MNRKLLGHLMALCLMVGIVNVAQAQGKLIREEIFSPALANNRLQDPATRELTLYLPPSYDSSEMRYPVIYMLHGFGGDNNFFMESVGESLALFLLDNLMLTTFPEMILVMPDGNTAYRGSFYTNSELNGNYADYITQDVVGYIDSHYRTIPERDSRILMGASMGGYGTLKLGMKRPDLWCILVSMCPPVDLDGNQQWFLQQVLDENPDEMAGPASGQRFTEFLYGFSAAASPNLDAPPFFVDLPFIYPSGEIREDVWQRWLEHDITAMFERDSEPLRQLKGLYLDIGDNDELGFTPGVLAFHEKLVAASVEHELYLFEGGHSDKPVERFLSAMDFVARTHLTPPTAIQAASSLPVMWGTLKAQ